MASRAGHDINYLARAGVLGMQGPAGAPPQVPGFQLADFSGGLWSVIGILAALHERARTGQGRVVDVAMTEASMGFALAGFGPLFAGQVPARGDEPLTGGLALYGAYATKDGKYVTLGALEPKFWQAFCAGAGIEPDMGALLPGEHQEALREKLRGDLRVAHARRVGGVRPPARLLPRAGARAGRATRRPAARGARHVLRDGLAVGPHRAAPYAARRARGAVCAAAAPGRAHRRHPPRGGAADAEIAAMRAEGAAR